MIINGQEDKKGGRGIIDTDSQIWDKLIIKHTVCMQSGLEKKIWCINVHGRENLDTGW